MIVQHIESIGVGLQTFASTFDGGGRPVSGLWRQRFGAGGMQRAASGPVVDEGEDSSMEEAASKEGAMEAARVGRQQG